MNLVEERNNIVFDLAWHPSGKFLAAVGADGILSINRLCDDGSFKLLKSIQRERTVRRVEWSPDGTMIATAGFDSKGIIYNFDPNSSTVLTKKGTLEGQESELKTVRWSPDGKYLATTSRDKSLYIWDTETFDFVTIHNEHTADVKDAAFSPDGAFIVTVSFDGTVKVWDPMEEFGSLKTFTNHEGTVWSVAFNSKNEFVTVGEDGKAILYQKENEVYEYKKTIQVQKMLEPLYSVCYSDGKWIIAGSQTKIYLIDDNFDNIISTIPISQSGDINCVRPNPTNTKQLAIANDDGTIIIHNL